MTDKRLRSGVLGLAALLALGLAPTASTTPLVAEDLALATVYSGGVDLQPTVSFSQAIVTVSRGDIVVRRVFESGEYLSVGTDDLEGNTLPDGVYTWELELIPNAATARELRIQATLNGGKAPDAWSRQSGTLAIRGGLGAAADIAEATSLQERASGLQTSTMFDSGLGSSGFSRTEVRVDDDAAVGDRAGVEKEVQAAADRASADLIAGSAGLIQAGRTAPERSDAGALAMGGSLESAFKPQPQPSLFGEAKPAPRSISPDGKDGRPTSKDELR